MTDYGGDPAPPQPRLTYQSRRQIQVDLLRYWAAMLVVAAIAAFAGIIVLRMAGDVFDTPLLVPDSAGSDVLVPLSDSRVIWVSVLVTLAAAGVLNLMLYVVPRPEWFFSILAVVVLGASLMWPFSLAIEDAAKAWLVALQVVVGLIIMCLTLTVAGSVSRVAPVTDPAAQRPPATMSAAAPPAPPAPPTTTGRP